MPSQDILFSSASLGSINVSNRLVMAPMTRSLTPGGVLKEANIDYYRKRAAGGIGLIISEGTCIDHPSASGYPDVPFIGRADTLEAWTKLASAVHEHGTLLMPQLWHVGAIRKPGMEPGGDTPGWSPSGYVAPGKHVGYSMTESDIAEIIAAYVKAAEQARQAGCDGVEIHGAHGYLIDQFFWPETNLREDNYGGDMARRSRFAIEVISAIRKAVGPDFSIVIRISQWKQQDYEAKLCITPESLAEFINPLADAGVDIFHCSTRRFWEPEFEGSQLNLAGWVKKLSGKPTITVGSVGLNHDFLPTGKNLPFSAGETANLDQLVERLEADEFDLVAVGRALIANPDWANKVRSEQFDQLVGFDSTMLGSL